MNQILLNGIEISELKQIIAEIIRQELTSNNINSREPPSVKYLSRNEVAILLKISLPTLNEYSKFGILQSYRIGNRVLYKKNEVENAIVSVKNLKHKKINPTK